VSIGKILQTRRRIEMPSSPGPIRTTVYIMLQSEAEGITIFRNVGKYSIPHNIHRDFIVLATAFECVGTLTHYAPCAKPRAYSVVLAVYFTFSKRESIA